VRIHSRAHGVTAGLPLVMKPIVRRTYARSPVFSRAQHPAREVHKYTSSCNAS